MKIRVDDPDFRLYVGDAREVLGALPDGSVDCCVTSPPYWGLRDYGMADQLGNEPTPRDYIDAMAAIFTDVRRVLSDQGTLWLNLGDTFRDKQLLGIPWRVAFAMQEAANWWLRCDVIWHKLNPMPSSVTDRPTTSHEYVFLFSKSSSYFYDQDAVREPAEWERWGNQTNVKHEGQESAAGWIGSKSKRELTKRRTVREGIDTNGGGQGAGAITLHEGQGRNIRSVWPIPTQPYPEAHFATFPERLPELCIKAGCPEGGTVLDPFMGSGTTALVARKLARKAVGIELNPEYADLCARRLQQLSLFGGT